MKISQKEFVNSFVTDMKGRELFLSAEMLPRRLRNVKKYLDEQDAYTDFISSPLDLEELQDKFLVGLNSEDGHRYVTSPIVGVSDDMVVTTKTGSHYKLIAPLTQEPPAVPVTEIVDAFFVNEDGCDFILERRDDIKEMVVGEATKKLQDLLRTNGMSVFDTPKPGLYLVGLISLPVSRSKIETPSLWDWSVVLAREPVLPEGEQRGNRNVTLFDGRRIVNVAIGNPNGHTSRVPCILDLDCGNK